MTVKERYITSKDYNQEDYFVNFHGKLILTVELDWKLWHSKFADQLLTVITKSATKLSLGYDKLRIEIKPKEYSSEEWTRYDYDHPYIKVTLIPHENHWKYPEEMRDSQREVLENITTILGNGILIDDDFYKTLGGYAVDINYDKTTDDEITYRGWHKNYHIWHDYNAINF